MYKTQQIKQKVKVINVMIFLLKYLTQVLFKNHTND